VKEGCVEFVFDGIAGLNSSPAVGGESNGFVVVDSGLFVLPNMMSNFELSSPPSVAPVVDVGMPSWDNWDAADALNFIGCFGELDSSVAMSSPLFSIFCASLLENREINWLFDLNGLFIRVIFHQIFKTKLLRIYHLLLALPLKMLYSMAFMTIKFISSPPLESAFLSFSITLA
jgi:hypothetical protein